ncbi:hypothetical protein FGG08_006263 [Glutinoglossum americanum]|uniref:DUF7580 domain-containing protein n=1 Tax=Glutinoglossum americanum TaxID=1670608 RepID=A0A9P8I189_9PEZI|nr:hypothetical protein FGG08_006263 [Glutinoglossum americanum]
MSGIEVAGLLLGALPVLFKAVDLSKDGIKRSRIFFQKRIYVEKLALALLLQQRTLAETVRSLLIGSGCEDVWRLDDDPFGYLNDRSVRDQVLDYLGPENDAAFAGALKQSDDIVKKIVKNIAGLVPAVKDHDGNLLGIIKANQEANARQLDLVPRVKLTFGASELKSAIRDLDDTTNTLCHFARIMSSNRQLIEGTSPRKAVKLAKALRRVRGSASNLYLAIFQGWRTGCHEKHEAKLFLEDRVDTAADILKQARRDGSAPVLVFQLIFAVNICQGQTLWHEAVVPVLKDDTDGNSNLPVVGRPSASPGVKLIVPESTSAGPEVTFVDDICATIETARCSKRQIAFVLTGSQQMGTIPTDEKMLTPCHQADKMTLNTLLSDNRSNHHNILLPLRFRMLLALRLASNLLQLLQTQWLQSAWSKDVIYFLLRPTGEANNASRDLLNIDFDRPFVSLSFGDNNASAPLPQQSVNPRVALLELGILLLEIWHKRTLEAQFSLEEAPVEYYERLALALKWLDDMDEPMPELYDKAVSHCVRGMIGGETRFRDWEDIGFWGAICGDIIEPLFKNCGQWRYRTTRYSPLCADTTV